MTGGASAPPIFMPSLRKRAEDRVAGVLGRGNVTILHAMHQSARAMMEELVRPGTSPMTELAYATIASRPADEVIATGGHIYIERWTVERTAGTQVCVHRYTRPDWAKDMHDHVGDNSTLVVSGWLDERTLLGEQRLLPGDFVVRKAEDRHVLFGVEPGTVTVWTRGKRVRDWGFYQEPTGIWVPAEQYIAEHDTDQNR